ALNELLLVERLATGAANDYALGVEVGKYKGQATISHGGGWAGFRTLMLRFPDRHLGIALFSNHGSVDPQPLVSRIADIYLGLETTNDTKVARQQIELAPAILDGYVGQYELTPGLIIAITRDGDH